MEEYHADGFMAGYLEIFFLLLEEKKDYGKEEGWGRGGGISMDNTLHNLSSDEKIVDGNKYQLHNKSNQTHDEKPQSDESSNLGPFRQSRLGALVEKMYRVLLELDEGLNESSCWELLVDFIHSVVGSFGEEREKKLEKEQREKR